MRNALCHVGLFGCTRSPLQLCVPVHFAQRFCGLFFRIILAVGWQKLSQRMLLMHAQALQNPAIQNPLQAVEARAKRTAARQTRRWGSGVRRRAGPGQGRVPRAQLPTFQHF